LGLSRFSLRGRLTKRRAIFGSGIIGTIIAIFGFTLLSGPLQFIHLSQILQRNFAGNDNTSSIRLKGLFRYARSGNIGETRVSVVGSQIFGHTIDQLKAVGVEFQTNSAGYVKSATLDPAKLNKNFPKLDKMTEAEKVNFLTDKFGLSEGQLVKDGPVFKVNTSDFGIKATRALVNNANDVLDDGAIVSAIKSRVLTKYFDLPSLLHPIARTEANLKTKLSVKAQLAADQKAEKDRLKQLSKSTTTPDAVEARTRVKNAFRNNQSLITGVIIAQSGLCLVRSIADDAIILNRTAIVLPAALQAADKIAFGEQVKSNQDFRASQLSAAAATFTDDKGQSIWEGKALQVTAGVTDATGPDLKSDYAQAFSGKTTADNIKSAVSVELPGTNVDISGALCSSPALIISAAVGIGLLAAGAPTGGASWGGYVALKAGELAATGGIVYLLQQQLTPLLSDQAIVPDVLSGPLGGNLLAYGARELANIDGRSSGGVALAGTETSTVSPAEQVRENQQFNSKGSFAKLFDAKDYRSVAGRLIDNTSTNFFQNLAKMGSVILHFDKIFSWTSQIFATKANAAPQPYNWGFPRYGIPDSLATDPRFENPYANAEAVAALLKSNDSYISRAKACFGVDLNKDSNQLWQVVPSDDVNPGGSSYTGAGANCNDQSENWQRIMLFVFDSRTMDAAACYNDDEESCANTGISPSSTPTPGSTPGTYLNPLRDVQKNGSLVAMRIDQGVDYGGSGPVYALGNGTVLNVYSCGWGSCAGLGGPGAFIVYKLDDGPAAGKYVFVAENCPWKVNIGDHITSSTVLCTMVDASPHMEMGWANGEALGEAMAASIYKNVPNGTPTAFGVNFSDLMKSLGGTPGDINRSASQTIAGSLPGGWPTW
jgi:hypothetical protein